MYANHFGLDCLPFDDRQDPPFFYTTADREEALAAMQCRIEHGNGVALTLGEAGTGKTLLIRTLLRRLTSNHRAAVITCPPNGSMELLKEVCRGLGITLPGSTTAARMLNQLRRHLHRASRAGTRSILIIDQAENLSAQALTELATIADLRDETTRLLSVTILAQPQFRSMLNSPELSRLSQELYGEWTITPFNEGGTREYIRHRLRAAGRVDQEIFTSEACDLIHRATGGVPRLVNRLCDAALIAAYGGGAAVVTVECLGEVLRSSHPSTKAMPARELGLSGATNVASGLGESTRSTPTSTEHCEPQSEVEKLPGHDDIFESVAPLGRAIDQFLPRADRACDRLSTFLREVSESAERIHASLTRRLREVERRTGEWESSSTQATEVVGEVTRHVNQAEVVCRRAEEIGSRLTSFADQIADKADELQSRIDRLLRSAAAAQTIDEKLAETVGRAEAAPAALLEQEQRINARIEQRLQALDAKADALLTSFDTRINGGAERATCVAAEAERAVALIETRLSSLSGDMDVEVLAGRLKGLRSEIVELETRAEDIADKVAAVDSPLVEKLRQAGDLHAQVTASLMEVGAGCERVHAARQQIDDCRKVTERFEFQSDAARKLLHDVERRTETLDQSRARLEQMVTRADGCAQGLEVQTETSVRILHQLTAGATRADEIVDRAAASAISANQACDRASEQVTLLAAAQESGAAMLTEFAASKNQGAKLNESLVAAIARADDKLARLGSHQAAAGQALERISEATVAAHKTIQRLESLGAELNQTAEKTSEQCDEVFARLSGLVSEAGGSQAALAEQNDASRKTIPELQQALALAAESMAGVQTRIEQAIHASDDLTRRCEQVTAAAGDKLSELIQRAGHIQESIESTVGRAGELNGQLIGSTEEADSTRKKLGELLTEAREAHHNISDESESTIHRISDQLGLLSEAGESLNGCAARMEQLQQSLAQVKTRADRLTVSVAALGDEPKQVMESARTQTAELERVLAAVRKIFTGLSQASLEAKKQAGDLDAKGKSAADRLARLAAHTEKAARTLNQWIEEAIRVQARLETTLQEAPSISDTHSSDSLQEIAESIQADANIERPIERSASRVGPVKHMPARLVPTRPRPIKGLGELRPPSDRRAEQVARIIEEAKRGG